MEHIRRVDRHVAPEIYGTCPGSTRSGRSSVKADDAMSMPIAPAARNVCALAAVPTARAAKHRLC
jgi:hypothetical protein